MPVPLVVSGKHLDVPIAITDLEMEPDWKTLLLYGTVLILEVPCSSSRVFLLSG